MNPPKEILQIPVEDIIPNRFQPRISFDEKALNDLASSIKQHGIIQPLVVRRLGEKYEIIAGERRYKAATRAGLTSVPAVITEIDDRTSAEVALVENVQRKDLTAIEEARSYKNLLEKNGMTQEEIAKKMGISQSAVANKLRLLNLSERVQEALLNEKISERHARSLLVLSNQEEQDKWLDKIINERLTVRQLDTLIKKETETESEAEEDVPLVNIEQTIEDIKNNATDIISYVNEDVNSVENEKQENRFFNNLEDEPVSMGPTSPIGSPVMPVFSINEEQPQTIETTPKVFDDIELLDVDIPIQSESLEESQDIEVISEEPSETSSLGDIISSLRSKINELNINENINFEELDLGDSYKINITIIKK